MTVPKYPEITVKLVGGDGNAFSVLGHVIRAMRRAKLSDEEITPVPGRRDGRGLRPSVAYRDEIRGGGVTPVYNDRLDLTLPTHPTRRSPGQRWPGFFHAQNVRRGANPSTPVRSEKNPDPRVASPGVGIRFVRVFQFAERTSGNKEFIFSTGNLMAAASPATPR
jgi:hypothetical protein